MRTGFEPGSKPVFEPPRRRKHITLPGISPSRKVEGGWVRTRSPLMMDGLIHLEVNPQVTRIVPYPIQIEYPSDGNSEMFKMRDHMFELGVELRSGQRLYLDYVPVNIQEERKWIKDRTARLKEVCRDELGASYALHDERTLHIQPRFANLKIMYRLIRATDDEALMVVRRSIAQMDLPTTVGLVRAEAKLANYRFEATDHFGQNTHYQRELTDVDRVLTAVLQMVAKGEINIDFSRPFGDSSLLLETTA